MMPFRFIPRSLALIVWLVSGLLAPAVWSAPAPLWKLQQADCDYLVLHHVREAIEDEPPVEQLQLRCGAGTRLFATRDVTPARLIEDLQLDLWVRSDRQGLQLLGQVVFPETMDPETGRPATLMVPGSTYERVGQWQRLQVDQFPRRIQSPLRVLRARLRQPLRVENAYLRAAMLNVYGGPGTTTVSIGQHALVGAIAPDRTIQSATAAQRVSKVDVPQRQGTRLIVDGRPFFARLIEHQGESFELLHQLGFNTVFLPAPATRAEMVAARDAQLWIVCPPPAEFSTDASYERILAWYVDDADARTVRVERLELLRRQDPDKRPLIGNIRAGQWQASRQLDMLVRTKKLLGTGFQLSRYGPWLDQSARLVRPGTPFWSGVQTQLPPDVVRQTRLLGQDVPLASSARVQSEQIRQMALAGIASGARGLWFHSDSPLDASTRDTVLRRTLLEWINHELRLLGPWAMGGNGSGEIRASNPQVRVIGLATDRSRLLIPTHIQPHAQLAYRPPRGTNRITVAGVPDSTDAYLLSHGGLDTLNAKRTSGGLQIELPESLNSSLVLLTEDPLVVTHINRTVDRSRARMVELEQAIVSQLIDEFEMRWSQDLLTDTKRIRPWQSAREALTKSLEMRQAGDLSAAFHFGNLAHRHLSHVQTDLWEASGPDRRQPLRSPFFASYALAKTYADAGGWDAVENRLWSNNRLAGGDCEDFEAMIRMGWRQFRDKSQEADLRMRLALSPDRPHAGQRCLRIAALPRSGDATIVEVPPIRVNSAPVTVQPGQRYRISGWIRIAERIPSEEGVTIGDNIAGPSLAWHVHQTKGWQPFEMVRVADQHDHLVVTITLPGAGQLWLDDLSVQVERAVLARVDGR